MPNTDSRPPTTTTLSSLDREWLSNWIRPSHLEEDALDTHAAAYHSKSVPVVQIPDFLRSDVAQKLTTFLTSEAEYEEIYGLVEPDEQVSRKEWQAAKEENRMYKFLRFKQARPDVRSLNPFVYKQFRDAFSDPRFLAFFERLSETRLGTLQSFGGKAYRSEDYLRPHDDTGHNRRLAFILYLNPNWSAEYGGALHIVGHDGQVLDFEVAHNSLVVFDVQGHKYHYVKEIMEEAGSERRQTLGGWFTAPPVDDNSQTST